MYLCLFSIDLSKNFNWYVLLICKES